MLRILAATAAVLMVVAPAQAHGPARQKTSVEMKLDATPEEVWIAIGQFDDMSWHPAVASTEAEADSEPGDMRVLTLQDGATLTEELTKYDAEKRTYSYRLAEDDVEVLPVTNYSSHITVKDDGGQALVEWRGAFYRGFPNNDPPAELNDEAAIAAVNALYQAGLDALAEEFGRAE